MKRILLALIFGLLGTTAAMLFAAENSTSIQDADKQSIQQQFDRWVHAYENGDAQTVTDIYAPDAILLLPNMKPLDGTAQLRSFFDQLCRTKVTYIYTVKQIEVNGNWAFRWGLAQVIDHRKGGQDVPVNLKFIDVWKKESNGTWKIYRDSSVIDASHSVEQHKLGSKGQKE